MIWGSCSWSGLGSTTVSAQRMRSANYLNMLNDQVIPSMDFFFPDGTGILALAYRHYFDTWIVERIDLNPIENLWDVLEKALRSGQTLPSSISPSSW